MSDKCHGSGNYISQGDAQLVVNQPSFRVSFCGGGSDMTDFYRECGGCVLSASINHYMYMIMLNDRA